MFYKTSDNAVILGSGPSIKNINYFNIPKDYDVFRCNQFYLEDKYYFGRCVDLYFVTGPMLKHQLKTIDFLTENKEYTIRNIIVTEFLEDRKFKDNYGNEMTRLIDICRQDSLTNIIINNIFQKRVVSSTGVNMCLVAKNLGYKNIYIGGIDFYEKGFLDYGIDCLGKKNLSEINPAFKEFKEVFNIGIHNPKYDIEILKLIQKDVNLIFLNNNETIKENFSNSNLYLEKNKDSLKDILIGD